ncbi:hypothetical protein HDU96_009062 [Phlyctochytrium bullatum]|nr:hypothetical protein HDU96_009062 [Phlyctochytrium bullatum]
MVPRKLTCFALIVCRLRLAGKVRIPHLPLHHLPISAATPQQTPRPIFAAPTTPTTPTAVPVTLIQPPSPDPCAPLSYNATLLASDVVACYSSFPLTDDVRTRQITAAKSYLQLYPYLHIAKAQNGFDILGELDLLQSDTSLTTEYALQSRISMLFVRLRDAHTVYSAVCFSVNQFVQPWVVGVKYPAASARPVVVLRDTIDRGSTFGREFVAVYPDRAGMGERFLERWKGLLGKDVRDYVGWEVIEVDGMDAVTSVQTFADLYLGLSHTPQTRFNKAIASSRYYLGSHDIQDGVYTSTGLFPDTISTTRKWTLRNPANGATTTLEVPWLAFLAVKTSRPMTWARYYNAICRDPATGGAAPVVATAVASGDGAPFQTPTAPRLQPRRRTSPDGEATGSVSIEPGTDPTGTETEDFALPAVRTTRLFRGSHHSAVDLASYLYRYSHRLDLPDSVLLRTNSPSRQRGVGRQPSTSSRGPAPIPPALLLDNGAAFYMLKGNRTAVMVLPAFEPGLPSSDDLTETALIQWMANMAEGLARVQSAGAERLVLDFSGNGGGVICAGKALLDYMFIKGGGKGATTTLAGDSLRFVQYDVRMGPENRWLMEHASVWEDAGNVFWLDGQVLPVAAAEGDGAAGALGATTSTTSVGATRAVLAGTRNVTRAWPSDERRMHAAGTLEEPVTGRFRIDCKSFDYLMQRFPRLPRGVFDPANVVILTNGFCGSTCGEGVRSLRRQFGVKTVVYGGGAGAGEPFQPTTFEGGSVLQFSQVLASTTGIVGTLQQRSMPATTGAVGIRRRQLEPLVEDPVTTASSPSYGVAPSSLLLPQPFPQPVVGQVLHWQSYTDFIAPTSDFSNVTGPGPVSGLPDEWTPMKADRYLPAEDPTDIVRVWMGVAAMMGDEVAAGDVVGIGRTPVTVTRTSTETGAAMATGTTGVGGSPATASGACLTRGDVRIFVFVIVSLMAAMVIC